MLELRTFGGLSLSGSPMPAAARQPRRLALLVLLARGRDSALSRDSLMALLWPESTTEKARHALDQLVFSTRRDLGRDVIITESGRLRLNAGRVRSDCGEMEAFLAVRNAPAAVQLYTGPFLEGVYFGDSTEMERWVERERDLIAARVTAALDELVRDADEREDSEAAVRWRTRRVEMDPFNAGAVIGLMNALRAARDVPAALQQARKYATRIVEELGIEPDGAVIELAARIAPPALRDAAPAELATAPAGPTATENGSTRSDVDESDLPTVPHTPGRHGARRWAVAAAVIALLAPAGMAALWSLRAAESEARSNPAEVQLRHSPSAAAHDLYLRGRIEWNRRSREGLEAAVVLFRRAIEADPMSAEAHAGLAESYVMLGYHGYLPASSSFPKGKAAALRALELDSARGDAWSALGVALQAERRWTEADSAFREAIRRTPDYATAHQWYALLLMILGRGPEAVAHGRRAAELDPLSIQVNNTYGITLSNAGMLDSALAVYERIVTHEPDTAWVRENPWVLANFGKVAARAGRPEQGVALLHRALVAVPGHPRVIRDLVQVHVRQEDYERARETFAMVDTAHVQHLIYAALTHAELGDTDAAFDAFEHVQEWGLPSLLSVSGLGSMRSIREDPRYPALRARIGLPDPPPEPMRR